ncbi:hypothetical protein L915_09809 [Phytophthora nicotianae]|uniref:ZSWIM1/3 RNaseH-like domain-containing protein n=1 Tax=Phytophthora nicotianae TaxID=4792 RepID=W2GSM6_PHYNI|nr:hypothetical protein L915_09809 [Phytophthora nicotianae]
MGRDSAEDRLKDMLHALRQLDESDVLVMQDQMGLTTGVVMQSKLQKMMFERWVETLAMDFTHGTNNLGYHLGAYRENYSDFISLYSNFIVNSVSSCCFSTQGVWLSLLLLAEGFPVFDCISLDEQAVTISSILQYFKEKIPGWEQI